MSDYYILDENDCPRLTDQRGFYEWHEKLPEDTRTGLGFTLARTYSGNDRVSTVYLGLDHSFGDEPVVLWETMLFCEGDNDQECQRSHNRKEALQTHKEFCLKYLGIEFKEQEPQSS